MSEQYPDLVEGQERRENYLFDMILGKFEEQHPRRTIELSLSVGLTEISLEQPGKNSDLCICEASVFHQKEIDDFLAEFKSHLLELIDLHKISNEKRRKPKKPKLHEGEYSKKHNEEKILNFMKFGFMNRIPMDQLLKEIISFETQLKQQIDNANEKIRKSENTK